MMQIARNTAYLPLLAAVGGLVLLSINSHGCSAFQAPVAAIRTTSPCSGDVFSNRIHHKSLSSANSEYPDYDDFMEMEYQSYYDSTNDIMPATTQSRLENEEDDYYYADAQTQEEDRWKIDMTNQIIRVFYNSFKNVEGTANGLLEEDPAMAMTIFVGAGLVTAYVLGLFFLDGCMESWNPVQNGVVPYWDDEVLVMVRKVH